MEKNLRYFRLKWIALTLCSLVLGFTIGNDYWYTLYRSLQEAFHNVLSEAQYDALYGFYKSHRFVGGYFIAFFTWIFVVCLDYVIGQIAKAKISRNKVRK